MPSPHVSPGDGSDVSSWDVGGGALGARFDSAGRRRVGTTTKPTAAAGANAGVSATATVVGTDEHGVVTIGTGASGTGAGTLATLTFTTPFAVAPVVVLTPGDAVSAAKQLYATVSTTALTIKSAADPTAGQTLKVNYSLIAGA